MKEEKKRDADIYRSGRLTVLELMTVIAILGILLTWVLQKFMQA